MNQGAPTKLLPPSATTTVARLLIACPAMNQICVSPLAALCEMISGLPSKFMSSVATMLHGKPTKIGTPFSAKTVVVRN